MKRAIPEFVLLTEPSKSTTSSTTATATSSTCPYQIVFTTCRLKLVRHSLNEKVLSAIQQSLENGNLGRMPMKQTELKLHYIPSNVYSSICENIFVGKIPEKLIVMLVPTIALSGQITSNPYTFDHHDLTSITITTDSELGVYSHQLSIDADQNHMLEAYRSLFNLIPSLDLGNGLSREDFMKGKKKSIHFLWWLKFSNSENS